MRRGDFVAILAGFPCTSWSRARRWNGLGPGPLRDDDQHLWHGYPDLSAKDMEKALIGNALLSTTCRLASLAIDLGIPVLLENPATSRAWLTKPIQKLMKKGAVFTMCHFCQYGTPWKKGTNFLHANCGQFDLKCCHGNSGICTRTGEKHFILQGTDNHGVFWTLRAQPYPAPLCRHLVSVIKTQLGNRA